MQWNVCVPPGAGHRIILVEETKGKEKCLYSQRIETIAGGHVGSGDDQAKPYLK